MIKTDRASSNHYVLTVDTTRHRLANQKKKNGMWGKNRSQSIKSFAFGLRKTDNFQFAMTVYCINSIIRPVVINFMSFAFSYWKASLLSYMLTPRYTRTSACNRETCSGRLKLNQNIHVRIYVICRCSIE